MSEKNTVLQQLMSELGKAREEIKSVNKHKSDFIAGMSHILRTPLNTIIGYSEMLQEDAESEGLRNYDTSLAKVVDCAKQLMDILNDIFDLSVIESGKMEFFLEDITIEDMIKELEPMALALAKRNKNTLKVDIAPQLGTLHSDVARIRQCLLNLLNNAAKFTENGTITLEIKPLLQDNKSLIKFLVSDNGQGISPTQLKKLSHLLSQKNVNTGQVFETHLGLYLTKRLCEMLGGWMTVESEEGKGSIFSIILPLKTIPGTEELTESAKFSEVSASRKKTILIIDATLALHHEIQTALGKSGYTLLHAFDGEEGLKFARMSRPDVIVLDIPNVITLDVMLPLMDGWATLSALKADVRLAKIPVIVISLISEIQLGFNLKAVDYLHKPINLPDLIHKIRLLVPDEPTE